MRAVAPWLSQQHLHSKLKHKAPDVLSSVAAKYPVMLRPARVVSVSCRTRTVGGSHRRQKCESNTRETLRRVSHLPLAGDSLLMRGSAREHNSMCVSLQYV